MEIGTRINPLISCRFKRASYKENVNTADSEACSGGVLLAREWTCLYEAAVHSEGRTIITPWVFQFSARNPSTNLVNEKIFVNENEKQKTTTQAGRTKVIDLHYHFQSLLIICTSFVLNARDILFVFFIYCFV